MPHSSKRITILASVLLISWLYPYCTVYGQGFPPAPDPTPSFDLSKAQRYWIADVKWAGSCYQVDGTPTQNTGQTHIYNGENSTLWLWNTSNTAPNTHKDLWVEFELIASYPNDEDPQNDPNFETILKDILDNGGEPQIWTTNGESVARNITRITSANYGISYDKQLCIANVKLGIGYTITPNPHYETIAFENFLDKIKPSTLPQISSWSLKRIEAYSICVPEPTSITMLTISSLMGVGLFMLKRHHR